MLKVLLFVAIGLLTAQASAESTGLSDQQQNNFDNAFCSVVAENQTIGKLHQQGLKVNSMETEVYKFSKDIYTVLVKTQVYRDSLIVNGPAVGFNCFRCDNLKMVVSQDSMKEACSK